MENIGNTGVCNMGAWNTGDWNTGNFNTGIGNTGDGNTGNFNTGIGNTGDGNTGNWNIGNCNTGIGNTGDGNTGNWNIGNCNTGDWNRCDNSTGCFNTVEENIRLFNRTSNMTASEFIKSVYFKALYSVPFRITTGIGHFESDTEMPEMCAYKEACKNWWDAMTPENKDIVMSMPNFDADVFFEITGIDLRNQSETDKKASDANEYQQAALRTERGMPERDMLNRLTNGLMGLSGESGECLDELKKVLYQGHKLDKDSLALELGDVAWYLAVAADALGYDLQTIFNMNIEKLRKRYPNGFDAEHSINRESQKTTD